MTKQEEIETWQLDLADQRAKQARCEAQLAIYKRGWLTRRRPDSRLDLNRLITQERAAWRAHKVVAADLERRIRDAQRSQSVD